MPTKKYPTKQTFHEGEIKYLLSRAIRYGILVGHGNPFIGSGEHHWTIEIENYINEVLPSFMSRAKPTITLGNETYSKIKKG